MAKINSYLGKFESARTHINKSLKIYQQHYGKYHLKVIEPLIFSAHIELLAGNAALSKKNTIRFFKNTYKTTNIKGTLLVLEYMNFYRYFLKKCYSVKDS